MREETDWVTRSAWSEYEEAEEESDEIAVPVGIDAQLRAQKSGGFLRFIFGVAVRVVQLPTEAADPSCTAK